MNRRGMLKTVGAFLAGMVAPFGGTRSKPQPKMEPGMLIDFDRGLTYRPGSLDGFFTFTFAGKHVTLPYNATAAEIDKAIADVYPPPIPHWTEIEKAIVACLSNS